MNFAELIVKFYVLSCYEITILFLLFLSIFIACSNKFGRYLWWKLFMAIIMLGITVIIFKITVIDRQANSGYNETNLIPFHSYYRYFSGENTEALRCNLMNMLLFFPLGVTMGEVLPKDWSVWKKLILIIGTSFMLSTSIEYLQYTKQCGEVEVDDVLNNTLGAMFGMLSVSITLKLFQKLKGKNNNREHKQWNNMNNFF